MPRAPRLTSPRSPQPGETKPGEPQEHPFYFDTVWDLWRLLDYVASGPTSIPSASAMFGISMGGIQTWLAASVDERVARGRAGNQRAEFPLELGATSVGKAGPAPSSTPTAGRRRDLGEPEVNQRVCRELWSKVIPGHPRRVRLSEHAPLVRSAAAIDRQR